MVSRRRNTPVTPLTADVFGEGGDRVLVGTVQMFAPQSWDVSCCIFEEGTNRVFVHPELIVYRSGELQARYKFEITLEDGMVVLRRTQHKSKSAPTLRAPVLKPMSVTLERVLEMVRVLGLQGSQCAGVLNHTEPSLPLRLRQGILANTLAAGPRVHCTSCHRAMLASGVKMGHILDGRLIPLVHLSASFL
ncbi:hypothetical protein HOI18_00495 [Candidatus Uhrbacteria bacterium]|nr:hypothetical protein [Candidatus Uhrbacteria bacterium]